LDKEPNIPCINMATGPLPFSVKFNFIVSVASWF
jgi:hypothetical protein